MVDLASSLFVNVYQRLNQPVFHPTGWTPWSLLIHRDHSGCRIRWGTEIFEGFWRLMWLYNVHAQYIYIYTYTYTWEKYIYIHILTALATMIEFNIYIYTRLNTLWYILHRSTCHIYTCPKYAKYTCTDMFCESTDWIFAEPRRSPVVDRRRRLRRPSPSGMDWRCLKIDRTSTEND